MPKVSRESAASVKEMGPVTAREEDVEGYEISFVAFHDDVDGAPLLRGLPDDRCPCPHWGYVLKGRVSFTFADHDEVFVAGDAFYVPPSHSPTADAGSEMVLFSPAEQVHEVEAVMERNAQEMMRA